MAKSVQEIMNHELFTLRPDEEAGDAMHYLVSLGITGAPVVDSARVPLGFVTWRDLAAGKPNATVSSRMSAPARTIAATEGIDAAAKALCDANVHHLVAVDDNGRSAGIVGSLDVLRGMTGKPVPHPDTFPHWDTRVGLTWSNDARFERSTVEDIPARAPGLFVLIAPGTQADDRVVWCEAVVDLRDHLTQILAVPRVAPPHLAGVIERGELWFRFALAPSAAALHEAVTWAQAH